jgi:hypothetical protein
MRAGAGISKKIGTRVRKQKIMGIKAGKSQRHLAIKFNQLKRNFKPQTV